MEIEELLPPLLDLSDIVCVARASKQARKWICYYLVKAQTIIGFLKKRPSAAEFDVHGLRLLASHCRSLRVLHLHINHSKYSSFSTQFCAVITEIVHANCQTIEVCDAGMINTTTLAALAACPNLRSLSLQGASRSKDETIETQTANVVVNCRKLTALDLSTPLCPFSTTISDRLKEGKCHRSVLCDVCFLAVSLKHLQSLCIQAPFDQFFAFIQQGGLVGLQKLSLRSVNSQVTWHKLRRMSQRLPSLSSLSLHQDKFWQVTSPGVHEKSGPYHKCPDTFDDEPWLLPNLTELIVRCATKDNPCIHAPVLKKVEWWCCGPELKSLLEHSPNVEHAKIAACDIKHGLDIGKAWPSLKSLRLFPALSCATIRQLIPTLPQLTTLHITVDSAAIIHGGKLDDVDLASFICQTQTSLRHLTVELESNDQRVLQDLKQSCPLRKGVLNMPHLETLVLELCDDAFFHQLRAPILQKLIVQGFNGFVETFGTRLDESAETKQVRFPLLRKLVINQSRSITEDGVIMLLRHCGSVLSDLRLEDLRLTHRVLSEFKHLACARGLVYACMRFTPWAPNNDYFPASALCTFINACPNLATLWIPDPVQLDAKLGREVMTACSARFNNERGLRVTNTGRFTWEESIIVSEEHAKEIFNSTVKPSDPDF